MNVNVNLVEENVIQIKNGIMINVDEIVKKYPICEKHYIWNPATRSRENGKYLASIIDNSVLPAMKLSKKRQKQVQQILMKKMQSVKQKNSIFYLPFY